MYGASHCIVSTKCAYGCRFEVKVLRSFRLCCLAGRRPDKTLAIVFFFERDVTCRVKNYTALIDW